VEGGRRMSLKRRSTRGIKGRYSAPGKKRPGWHRSVSFTSSQSQPGNGARFVLFFLPWHDKTAVRLGRNSLHLVLSGVVTHYFQTSGVEKQVLLTHL